MARRTRTQTSDVSVGPLVTPSFLLEGAPMAAAVWATLILFDNLSAFASCAAYALSPLGGSEDGRDLESVARS